MNLKEALTHVGEEWAVDSAKDNRHISRVRILGSKKVEEDYVPDGSWQTSKRMITRLEVEFLDVDTGEVKSRGVMKPRDLSYYSWDLAVEIQRARIQGEAERKEFKATLRSALQVVIPDLGEYSVTGGKGDYEIHVSRKQAERLIELIRCHPKGGQDE